MYIKRDPEGKIIGAFRWPDTEGQENLDKNDPELQAFLNPEPSAVELLSQTEKPADLARKLEDIYEYLVNDVPLPVNPDTGKTFIGEWVEDRKTKRGSLNG